MRALLALPLIASCSSAPLSQQLRDACEARECPSDPPKYIDCMPVVADDWAPVCSAPCRTFLQETCKISFIE